MPIYDSREIDKLSDYLSRQNSTYCEYEDRCHRQILHLNQLCADVKETYLKDNVGLKVNSEEDEKYNPTDINTTHTRCKHLLQEGRNLIVNLTKLQSRLRSNLNEVVSLKMYINVENKTNVGESMHANVSECHKMNKSYGSGTADFVTNKPIHGDLTVGNNHNITDSAISEKSGAMVSSPYRQDSSPRKVKSLPGTNLSNALLFSQNGRPVCTNATSPVAVGHSTRGVSRQPNSRPKTKPQLYSPTINSPDKNTLRQNTEETEIPSAPRSPNLIMLSSYITAISPRK